MSKKEIELIKRSIPEQIHKAIEEVSEEHNVFMKKLNDFANNKYLEGIESTTSFSGGYAQALRDLKIILNETT